MGWERELVQKYQLATGNTEISMIAVANWALATREYQPPPLDESARLAVKLSKAMRQVHFSDPQGRSVRLMHAVTNRQGQTHMTFWYEMKHITPEKMKRSLQQRREQSLADNFQMKTDQDSYNENFNPSAPIQMIFDYTLDVEEMESLRKFGRDKSA